jgi:hypothetical protein
MNERNIIAAILAVGVLQKSAEGQNQTSAAIAGLAVTAYEAVLAELARRQSSTPERPS